MKILFAADEQPYSAFALKELSKLAMNTLADVTILGVQSGSPGSGPVSPDLNLALNRYREAFLNSWEGEGSPYALNTWEYEWLPVREGLWEQRLVCKSTKKECRVHLRSGNAVTAIQTEAKEDASDLIVLGCTRRRRMPLGRRARCAPESCR